LFRYDDEAGREEAEAFVALLLESRHPTESQSPQMAELPIYVTLTMRSEYLGACSLIDGLAEAINEGAYLVPRMTREQCREAIVGPARVCGVDLADALVERLLDDLASFAPWDDGDKPDQSHSHSGTDQLSRLARRADQLPVMQHALNQMWREAIKDRKPAERGIALTLSEYEAIGKVRGAINRHADDILKRLGPEHGVAEGVFRALTSGTTVANAVRRPTSFGELVKICGAGEPVVRNVVEAFRTPDCNFVLPEIDHKPVLDDATKIDLTHESLIRQWERLSTWLEKEGRAAHDWQRLNEDAGLSELLTGQRLANAIALRDEFKPTPAWAGRYNIDLDRVNSLVSYSKWSETKRSQDEAKRQRAVMLSLAGAALVCFMFAVFAGWELWSANVARANLQQALMSADEARANLQQALMSADDARADLQQALMSADYERDRARQALSRVTFVANGMLSYIFRGNAYVKKKDYDHAFADYNHAIALDPESAQAYIFRAGAYYVKKDYDHAFADYN
jgi:tetratricopeptide (TPR) repeat protein